MKQRLLLPTLAALLFNICQAQRHWENVDTAFGPLPASVHVYKSQDSLDGKPFIGYYISAALEDKHLLFTTQTSDGKRLTPAQFYSNEQSPLVVLNCTFFSYKTNSSLNLVVKNGQLADYNTTAQRPKGKDSMLYYNYVTRSALGINKKRKADISWTFTDSTQPYPYAFEDGPVTAKGTTGNPAVADLNNTHWKKWKMETAVGGGPTLVHNGKVYVTNEEEGLFIGGAKDKHPRTAMGYTANGQLIILAIQGRFPKLAEGATLEQEGKILQQLGCTEALNLDGGGSSCVLVNGRETIKPSDKEGQRPVPAVFMIKQVQ